MLDVGCGYNEFKQELLKVAPKIKVVGVDFSCPGADLIANAESLPFADKEFDVLTAFDMLEHILPDQVEPILNEFCRVSKRFVFSISHVPSVNKWKGEGLHPTVHSEQWWIIQIMKAGGLSIAKSGRYLTGTWGTPLRIDKGKSVILVGNGPSIMKADGSKIDAFDEVVRFNEIHLEDKYAGHTGRKLTLWSTFGKGMHTKIAQPYPERVLYIHGETGDYGYKAKEEYKLPRWYYSHVGDCVRARREWEDGLTGDPWRPTPERELIATSGLLVASYLLHVVGVPQITLVGFDHFSKKETRQHHYYNPGPFGRPKEHDGDIEALMFKNLKDKGRIVYM